KDAGNLQALRKGHKKRAHPCLRQAGRRYKNGGASLATRHLFFGAFVFAEEGFEGVGAGQIVEQALALLGGHVGGEGVGALLTELLEPGFVFGAELFLEFLAEALRERGALTGSGDGDLQRAAMRYSGIVEVAKLWNVHDVAEHATTVRFRVDLLVEI